MLPIEDTSYYLSGDIAGPTASAITVAAVGLVGYFSLLFVAVGLLQRALAHARAAKAAETGAEDRKLVPGYAVLHGQVETGDTSPAVSIKIHQAGRDYRVKNGMRHVWTEVERHVDARPFSLRLASGERVKVVPGDGVFLVDVLSVDAAAPAVASAAPRTPLRTRAAELAHPDFVYACGRLAAPSGATAYRTADEGFTLTPWQGTMLLSTEPLEQRYVRRARFHGGWLIGCLVAFLFANGVMFAGYWTKLVWGRPLTATVTNTRNWTTQGKHGPIQHYGIEAKATLGADTIPLSAETNRAFYTAAKGELARGRSIGAPFVVVASHPTTYALGARPTLHVVNCIFSWLLLGGVAIAYLLYARHTRAWYERKKVVDVGTGPLGYPDALA